MYNKPIKDSGSIQKNVTKSKTRILRKTKPEQPIYLYLLKLIKCFKIVLKIVEILLKFDHYKQVLVDMIQFLNTAMYLEIPGTW